MQPRKWWLLAAAKERRSMKRVITFSCRVIHIYIFSTHIYSFFCLCVESQQQSSKSQFFFFCRFFCLIQSSSFFARCIFFQAFFSFFFFTFYIFVLPLLQQRSPNTSSCSRQRVNDFKCCSCALSVYHVFFFFLLSFHF